MADDYPDDRDPPAPSERHLPRPSDAPPMPPPRGNGMATAALVLGILSICGGITALPGLICGIIGINRASVRGSGQGKAITGLILSILSLVGVPILLLLPAVKAVRDAAGRAQSSNNLK